MHDQLLDYEGAMTEYLCPHCIKVEHGSIGRKQKTVTRGHGGGRLRKLHIERVGGLELDVPKNDKPES